MPNKPKLIERPVPTVYRNIMPIDWFREFTFAERIKILFGWNLLVGIRVATMHNPGQIQPVIVGHLTDAISAKAEQDRLFRARMEAIEKDMASRPAKA